MRMLIFICACIHEAEARKRKLEKEGYVVFVKHTKDLRYEVWAEEQASKYFRVPKNGKVKRTKKTNNVYFSKTI